MSDEAVRKEFKRARQFAESNHAYLADVTIELLAKYGQAARSAAIQECADAVDNHTCRSGGAKENLRDRVLALKER